METFLSGYCRMLDKSRTVCVETEGGETTVDCAYENCPHAPVCRIGGQIRQLLHR